MLIRTFIAVSLIASTVAAVAGPAGAPKGAPAAAANPSLNLGPDTKETLMGTYDAVGNGAAAALAQGTFVTIATNNVKCANTTGCSIGIESTAQIQSAGADWAICLLIDGAAVSCQYQGVQAGPSTYVVGNARGWGTVAKGAHTVVTQLYSESASATYEYFQTDVRVYKP